RSTRDWSSDVCSSDLRRPISHSARLLDYSIGPMGCQRRRIRAPASAAAAGIGDCNGLTPDHASPADAATEEPPWPATAPRRSALDRKSVVEGKGVGGV